MRRLVLAMVIGAALVVAGCASTDTTSTTGPTTSGSTPGSTAATSTTAKVTGTSVAADGDYCTTVARINQSTGKKNEKVDKAEIEAVLGDMRSARDAAPSSVRKAWDTIIDVASELGDLDSKSEADSTKALALIFDPEFQAAVDDVSTYTEKECGFELEGFDDDEDDDGSNEVTTSTTGGGDGETAGLPKACSQLTKISDDDAEDKTSLYSVRVAICKAEPTASWLDAVVSRSAWSSMNGTEFTVTVPADANPPINLSSDDALAACKALDTYLASVDVDATITIGSGDPGEAKPTTQLATKKPGGACAA
jgi:hypothetical protein